MRSTIIASLCISAALAISPSVGLAISSNPYVEVVGTATDNRYGKAVASGDFNGDGYQDMVVGAASGSYITISYGSSALLTALTVSTSNTVVITGGSSTDSFGISLATGDVNNDGYDDILVGASTSSAPAGAAYLIYGKAAQLTSLAVESDATNIKFTGSSENLGNAVAMGDINGDGYSDMVIAGKNNGTAFSTAGAVYVVNGRSMVFSNATILTTATGLFTGEASGDNLGAALAVGDLNNDGLAEIAAGSPGNDDAATGAGSVYVVYGSTTAVSGSTSISSSPEFTGEVLGDNAGSAGGLAISAQSINGDTYNDLLVGAPNNDDGGVDVGAVYVVPGSATAYTSTTSIGTSTVTEITGTIANGTMPSSLASADINQDGYGDIIIGANAVNASKGAVYMIPGNVSLSGASLASAAVFEGASTGDKFGESVGTGDLNGDGFPEVLNGAPSYSAGANTGEVVAVYAYLDEDLDGTPGAYGVFAAMDNSGAFNVSVTTDCSDTDATVTENQTYWLDVDADGLGDPVAATTAVCSSTAPTGYASNANDTNDTIPNNGVEISGDAVDNDGDGLIDEVNTVAENGAHPYYSLQDVTDTTIVATNITNVVGIAAGMIEVTYADNSIYDYPVYTSTSTKATNVEQYQSKGYGIVLHKKGKKVYLVNLYTGDITDKVTIKKAGFTSSAMLLKDLRSNNKDEVIVTGKTKAKVTLTVVKVNATTGVLTKADAEQIVDKKVSVTKTKATSTKIKLRSAKSKTLETFKVKKNYTLKLI